MVGLVGSSCRPRTFLLGFIPSNQTHITANSPLAFISSLSYTICITLCYPLDLKRAFFIKNLSCWCYIWRRVCSKLRVDLYQPIIGTELRLMEWPVVAEKDYHHHLIRPGKRTWNMKAPRINSMRHHMALLLTGGTWG